MFCIVAFAILAVIGIFSASYRELAREALDCVLRRVTLRPCTTGFDEKMKMRILGSVINRSERAARLLNKNFEILSWLFFVLMIGSTIFAVRGLYFFYVTGSCSGQSETSFCLFDPKGESRKVTALPDSCRVKPTTIADLTLKGVDLSGAPVLNGAGKGSILMIGCYGCSYSRKVYGPLKDLALKEHASFSFVDFPVKVRTNLMTRLGACIYRLDPQKYWRLNDILFSADPASLDEVAFARRVTAELGLDWQQVESCLDAPVTQEAVTRQMDEAAKTNFFGTPTVFVNGTPLVGPKPPRVYAIALKGLLYWMK